MALFDIFKKKQKEDKKPEIPVKKVKKEKKASPRPEPVKAEQSIPKKKTPGLSYHILHSPHITEKATDLSLQGKYVFKVFDKANKTEIKKTIENKYGVDVVNVRTIRIAPKERRVGKHKGWRGGYKKAIIKLASGQKIEILPR